MADPNADYPTISRLAIANGIDLYNEARLLLQQDSPRAFALAVASAEELMKGVLAGFASVNRDMVGEFVFERERDGRKFPILTRHEGKHAFFGLFLLVQAAIREGGYARANEVLKAAAEVGDIEAVEVENKADIIRQIKSMETDRQDSLYVGVKGKGDNVKTPKKAISRAMTENLLGQIHTYIDLYVQAVNSEKNSEESSHVPPS